MTQNEVHALFWPWAILSSDKEKVSLGSENAVLPFKGSALLSSPRESRIIPIGGVADLSKLSESGQRDLYELPLVVGNESKKLLQIQGDETRWEISLSGARTRYETDEANQTQETSESIAIFDWWDAFDDISNLGLEPDGAIGWNKITEWFSKEKSSKDPRRALIVEIAETVGPKLNDRVRHLRRILFRRHDMVPVHEIRQFDERSLRWYVRQPGETLAEKAGNKQEVLAVVRQETFDTVENRVLKDFLNRCNRAANRYLSRFQDEYPRSQRVITVRRYARACKEYLALPEFNFVRNPRTGVQPNYVLQTDSRYRDIWLWYQKLLKNQDSEEEIWSWQGRLWADVCRLLVGTASQLAASTETQELSPLALSQSSFFISPEGRLGSRLLGSWGPGPLPIVSRKSFSAMLSVIDASQIRRHPLAKNCGSAGGHVYLVKESVSGKGSHTEILVIWSINALASTHVFDSEKASLSATSALAALQEKFDSAGNAAIYLNGLILASQNGSEITTEISPKKSTRFFPQVSVLKIGSSPNCWDDATIEIAQHLEQWL